MCHSLPLPLLTPPPLSKRRVVMAESSSSLIRVKKTLLLSPGELLLGHVHCRRETGHGVVRPYSTGTCSSCGLCMCNSRRAGWLTTCPGSTNFGCDVDGAADLGVTSMELLI